MDSTCVAPGHAAKCFIRRCKKLEHILVTMKMITTPFIPRTHLHLLGVDLNDLDLYSGITSPSVTRYFMPRTNIPSILEVCSDASWDWFLSQKGNFCHQTELASYLLRRVFMDYQDWMIPEIYHCDLHRANSERESDSGSVVEELDELDDGENDKESKPETALGNEKDHEAGKNSGDQSKGGKVSQFTNHDRSSENDNGDSEKDVESIESGEKSENANDDHELVVKDTIDEDIRDFKTADWLVYRFQRLFGVEIPDKQRQLSVVRSMELNNPQKSHTWALIDVNSCGEDQPSTAELLALISWNLRGIYSQRDSLTRTTKPGNMLNHVFPTLIITFDRKCCARVLYGYFDGRFQVQFTPVLDFTEFTTVISEELDVYLGRIDKKNYYDMMHLLLRWAWPLPQQLTKEAITSP